MTVLLVGRLIGARLGVENFGGRLDEVLCSRLAAGVPARLGMVRLIGSFGVRPLSADTEPALPLVTSASRAWKWPGHL